MKSEKEMLEKYAAAARQVTLRPEEKTHIHTRLVEAMKTAPNVVVPRIRKQSIFSRVSQVVRKIVVRA